ncbi:MAG: substrate-binding domain-containing protein [Micrococcales bacterium]
MRKTAGLLAAVAIAATALIASPANATTPTITAGGSSFSAGMFSTCAANYTNATVTYTSSSSGTGRTNFANGTFDFAGSDSAYGAADSPKPATGTYKYIPVVGGPIALIYNVAGVPALRLDSATVGKIWLGTITKWNDPAIVALNKGAKLPNASITPVYRNTKSGTNGNFSGYLAANGAAGWTKDQTWTNATGQATPAGTGAADSTAVVTNVRSTAGAIGYVDLKDAVTAGLKVAALKNAAGQFLKPTAAAAAKFLSSQPVGADGQVNINWAKKIAGGYNASLITYALVNTGSATNNGAAVKSFIQYVLNTCVPANASKLGYVALSGGQAAKARALALLIK